MTRIRTITAGGAAAVVLVGGAALAGSTAQASSDTGQPRMPVAPRALVSSCSGGHAVSMSRRATDYQSVAAGTTVEVEGSSKTFKGPRHGTDTVLVTVYAMASSGGAGELTSLALYKDGVGTPEGSKYFTYNNVLDSAVAQFCATFGKGQHSLAVRVSDGGGGATTMYYPTITYERFR